MLDHFRKVAFHFDKKNVVCGYCHSEINLELTRHVDIHYLETKCNNCNKKIFVKVNHAGTKHHKAKKEDLDKLVLKNF
ncbi:MAG: hypothetical protein QW331_04125 [Candidatus Woesearchaeota archaeon]